MHNELHQEAEGIPEEPSLLEPEQEKIRLITDNTRLLRKLIKISLGFAIVRICLFIFVIEFQEIMIINEKGKGYSDSWNVIFYVVGCLMDFLGSINDAAMLKFLNNDQQRLEKVKKEIADKTAVQTEPKAGSYQIYLSIFTLLKRYKYRTSRGISISETVRCLHLIMTVYIFGNMALKSQGEADGNFIQVGFFWIYIISIIFNVFELDLCVFQASDGPFLEKNAQSMGRQEEERDKKQNQVERAVKERFIKGARHPFQIFYFINILIMLGILILYFQQSFFTLMLIICISAHIIELLHEKHLQNKLLSTDLSRLPYKYLHPYKIISYLCKNERKIFIVIRSLTRMTIFMTILACFRDPNTPIVQSFVFWILNMTFVMGQIAKFNRLEEERLYRLTQCDQNTFKDKECAICLLTCQKSQHIVQLPCFANHIFHKKCMKSWLAQRKECPLCRFSLEMYELQ